MNQNQCCHATPLHLPPLFTWMANSVATCILLADFFDPQFKVEAEKAESSSSSKPAAMADVLPEGFFDDPKMDAKVMFWKLFF